MTSDLQPYREYKESGLPWLGEVPSHWRLVTLRRVAKVQLSNVDKHTLKGEDHIRLCNYTDVYHHRYIRPDLRFMEATALPREIEKFELQRGDVLITKDSEDWKDIAVPALVTEDMPGVLCGYHLAHIRPGEELYGEYLMWACRSESVALQFRMAANGVTRYGVSGPDIKAGLLPLPPIAEQKAIGFYLREIEQKVNRFIRNRRRLIEVLNEQKQAIINRAVTRGLDLKDRPKSPEKEMPGDIRHNWKSTQLYRITDPKRPIMYGIVLPGPNVDDGVPIVKGGNCEPGRLRLDLLAKTTREIESRYARSRLKRGDIVYSIRGSIGSAEVVTEEIEGANLTQDAARIAAGHGINIRWLLHAVRSWSFFVKLESCARGAAVKGINIRDLKRADIVIPPLDQQKAIAEFIDGKSAIVDEAVDRAKREINLIHEYRTRLITDVVTGKLDVHHLGQDMVGEFLETEDLDEGIDDEEQLGEEEYGFGEEAIE